MRHLPSHLCPASASRAERRFNWKADEGGKIPSRGGVGRLIDQTEGNKTWIGVNECQLIQSLAAFFDTEDIE
jgi:hypothetical protein